MAKKSKKITETLVTQLQDQNVKTPEIKEEIPVENEKPKEEKKVEEKKKKKKSHRQSSKFFDKPVSETLDSETSGLNLGLSGIL